jgi:DNA helicase-2/ATP-dependent DNA helicase PcrA
MKLTLEQREAVREPGHVCLLSCPGSGKTRTIIAKLLTSIEAVSGTTRRVACITHTNAAADEIECRLREICFSNDDLYYEVSTIHSFALSNILRPFHRLLPEFVEGMQILTSDNEEYAAKASDLLRRFSLNRNVIDEFERVQRTGGDETRSLCSLPAELQAEWCEWLDANSFVTLNEIVYHSGRIVCDYPHVASALASRYGWLLVDEFQDSSPSQLVIFRELHRYQRTTFFCVGDPNQSIYGFAGASPNLLHEFGEHIGANMTHRLTANFRSSAAICEVAERLCSSVPPMQAVGRFANEPQEPVLLTVRNPMSGIVGPFMEAVDALGIPLGKVAVLASGWVPLYQLGQRLREYGLPSIGPGARPYKRAHMISHLAEPVGAYLAEPDPNICVQIQRNLYSLLANLDCANPSVVYAYKGRVATCQILELAKIARRDSDCAAAWIVAFAEATSTVLHEAQFISTSSATALLASAEEMATDIRSRDRGDQLTVDELGIFARPERCVHLLTIHKAKGREFEAVAVIDFHDGRIPHFTVERMADDEARLAAYDEARRVVYVAATRAKRLLMFFSDTTDYRNRPSPFADEMGLA